MHRPLPPAGTDQERCRHKGGRKVTNRILFAVFCFVDTLPSFPAVYRERLGGGEDGGDPEEEAGPVGEGLRLLQRPQENLPDRGHQGSAGAV